MIWWGVQGQGDDAMRWAWEPNLSQRCWLLRIPLSSQHLWITNLCNFWIYLPAKIYYVRPWRCAYKTGRLLSPLKHHFTGARNTPHFSRPNKCLDWIIFKMYTIAANTTRCSPHVPANTFVQKRGSRYFQNINFWLPEWQFLPLLLLRIVQPVWFRMYYYCSLLFCMYRNCEQSLVLKSVSRTGSVGQAARKNPWWLFVSSLWCIFHIFFVKMLYNIRNVS